MELFFAAELNRVSIKMKSIIMALGCAYVRAWAYEAHHVIAGVSQCLLNRLSPGTIDTAERVLARLNNS
jgi:hypothetical protein